MRKKRIRFKKHNCFFFAWYMWFTRGGYCAIRKSRNVAGWHWLWSPDLKRWIHYEPMHPEGFPKVIIHKLWFKGYIKRGDLHD